MDILLGFFDDFLIVPLAWPFRMFSGDERPPLWQLIIGLILWALIAYGAVMLLMDIFAK